MGDFAKHTSGRPQIRVSCALPPKRVLGLLVLPMYVVSSAWFVVALLQTWCFVRSACLGFACLADVRRELDLVCTCLEMYSG